MTTAELIIKAQILEKLEALLEAMNTAYVEEVVISNQAMETSITAYKEEDGSSRLFDRIHRALTLEQIALKKELGVD